MSNPCRDRYRGIVYVKRTDGHRRSYQELFSRLFRLEPVEGGLGNGTFQRLFVVRRLIFSTLDDDYFGFILIALARAMRGHLTVAIFFRPMQCFETGKAVYPLKRWFFRALKHLPGLSILTIIPFSLRPNLELVATGWVHDPQLWDLGGKFRHAPTTALNREVLRRAAGRRVMYFIGFGTEIKGFKFLCEIIRNSAKLRDQLFVAAAGLVDTACIAAASDLEASGMLVENRIISNAEIVDCYNHADLIWCCYRPDYDQASGIFGRAIQSGRRPVVRAGSVVHDYEEYSHVPAVALSFGDVESADRALRNALDQIDCCIQSPPTVCPAWRDEFLWKIHRLL